VKPPAWAAAAAEGGMEGSQGRCCRRVRSPDGGIGVEDRRRRKAKEGGGGEFFLGRRRKRERKWTFLGKERLKDC